MTPLIARSAVKAELRRALRYRRSVAFETLRVETGLPDHALARAIAAAFDELESDAVPYSASGRGREKALGDQSKPDGNDPVPFAPPIASGKERQ